MTGIAEQLILVPNNRLKRWLIDNQKTVDFLSVGQEKCQIHTLHSWLLDCWQRSSVQHQYSLLSPLAERLLWQEAAAISAQRLGLADDVTTHAIISQLSATHQWCYDYCVTHAEVMASAQSQPQQFFAYAQAHYQRLQEAQRVVNRTQLFALLAPHMAHEGLLVERIDLCNFLALTPCAQALFESLAGATTISHHSVSCSAGDIRAQALQWRTAGSASHTFLDIIEQARLHIEQDQKAHVAVVVHDLERQRAVLQAVCVRVFRDAPEMYNMSLAPSYLEEPSVACVLAWLAQLQKPTITNTDLLHLLLHGHATSVSPVGELLDTLRAQSPKKMRWQSCWQLLQQAQAITEQTANALAVAHAELVQNDWQAGVHMLLDALGWRAPRAVHTCMLAQVAEVARRRSVSCSNAATVGQHTQYAHLRWLLGEQRYTPTAAPAAARIQIVGTLESAAVPFDYVFVCDAIAQVNIIQRHNQLLSPELQEQYQLPYSRVWCEQQRTRLLACWRTHNSTVIFQYQADYAPSVFVDLSLYQPCQSLPVAEVVAADRPAVQHTHPNTTTQTVGQELHAQLRPMSETVLSGGTGLFEAMQTCPLRAQLVYRFDLVVLPFAPESSRRMQAGSYIHALFEEIYQQDRQTSQMQSDDALYSQLTLLSPSAQRRAFGAITPLSKVVAHNLHHAVVACIRHDDPSARVLATEYKAVLQLGEHQITVRLDRLDYLPQHNRVRVVDYKHRKLSRGMKALRDMTDSTDWSNAPNTLPVQLMLYALVEPRLICDKQQATIGEVAYAHVHYGAKQLWQAVEVGARDAWREYVMQLLAGYIAGECQAQPKASHCRYCPSADVCTLG